VTTEFRRAAQKINTTTLFFLYVKHAFFFLLTLSWYRFFTRTEIRKYLWQHIEIDGEPLEYTGKGIDLLIGYLKALLILVPVYGAWFVIMFFTSELVDYLLAFAGIIATVFFTSVAYYGAFRYRLSRTVFRGIHFGLRGSAWRFGLVGLKHSFLTFISFGFYTPYATNENWGYIVNNIHYGNQNFRYEQKRKVPMGSYVAAFFLTFVTFGICWYWYDAAMTRHCVQGVTLNGMQFKSTLTGGRLFGFSVLNWILLIVSLGLLYPFIVKRTIELHCDTTLFAGDLDYSLVRQEEAQLGAASEGFVEILGLE